MAGTSLKQISFWSRRYCRRAIQLFASHVYLDPNPDIRRSILVAGTTRSRTTWLGNLIASKIPGRIFFESFNSERVREYRRFHFLSLPAATLNHLSQTARVGSAMLARANDIEGWKKKLVPAQIDDVLRVVRAMVWTISRMIPS